MGCQAGTDTLLRKEATDLPQRLKYKTAIGDRSFLVSACVSGCVFQLICESRGKPLAHPVKRGVGPVNIRNNIPLESLHSTEFEPFPKRTIFFPQLCLYSVASCLYSSFYCVGPNGLHFFFLTIYARAAHAFLNIRFFRIHSFQKCPVR